MAVSIVLGSLVVAGLLVFDASKDNGGILKLVKSGLEDYRFAFSSGKEYREVAEGNNLTDRFIQNYGSQIALKNPNGPEGDTLTLPSQNTFDTLLAKEVAAGVSYEPIAENDLRAVADSKENVSAYLAAMRGIVSGRKTDLWKSLFEFSESGNANSLLRYVAESQKIEGGLATISVPESWKRFHADLINFERRRIAVVLAIAKSDEDPVNGLAAMEEFINLSKDEVKLAETFAEKTEGI